MGAPLSKTERLRAQRRGFQKFIEQERRNLEEGVYSEDLADWVERNIAEYEEKIARIDRDIGDDDPDQVLDEEREEIDDGDCYETDEEARADGFGSKRDGNEHDRAFRRELKHMANIKYEAEAHLVEDLASEGMTKKEIYGTFDEYCQLYEDAVRMFGG